MLVGGFTRSYLSAIQNVDLLVGAFSSMFRLFQNKGVKRHLFEMFNSVLGDDKFTIISKRVAIISTYAFVRNFFEKDTGQ